MKIIDLLNKIANGEEVPNKIKKDGVIYIYQAGIDYINSETSKWLMDDYYITEENLNKKVEIIEEEKEDAFTGSKWFARGKEIMSMEYPNEEEKDIEEIKMIGCNVECKALNTLVGTDTPLATEIAIVKINELIREVNKLKNR